MNFISLRQLIHITLVLVLRFSCFATYVTTYITFHGIYALQDVP